MTRGGGIYDTERGLAGPYRRGSGGLDRWPAAARVRESSWLAIERPSVRVVFCELLWRILLRRVARGLVTPITINRAFEMEHQGFAARNAGDHLGSALEAYVAGLGRFASNAEARGHIVVARIGDDLARARRAHAE